MNYMNGPDEAKDFLEQHCAFDRDIVYVLLLIGRKAENDDVTHNTEPVVRRVLYKDEHIDRYVDELYTIASKDEGMVWRLYVTVNGRNVERAYWNFMDRLFGWARRMNDGDRAIAEKLRKVDSEWVSELQRPSSKSAEKHFMFDLDTKDEDVVDIFQWELNNIDDYVAGYVEIIEKRETPNGWHFVTTPFNPSVFSPDIEYELKKDGLLFVDKMADGTNL